MTQKIGNGSIPLRIGNLIDAEVFGGPYRERPQGMVYVKMAEEIMDYCDIDIPTKDFNVPQIGDLRAGVMRALMVMTQGHPVYVGCMGGIGRTGLFLAALAKVQIEYRKSKHRKGRGDDPVLYVRKHFIPHAVETEQQQQFITDFDVSDFVEWLDVTQRAMGLGGLTPPKASFDTPGIDSAYGVITADSEDYYVSDVPLTFGDIIERDLDSALDAEEGTIEDEQWADLYETIDELESRLKLAEDVAQAAYRKATKALTKPTIFEKIKMWFGK